MMFSANIKINDVVSEQSPQVLRDHERPSQARQKILEQRCSIGSARPVTSNNRPKVPNHEKITSGSPGWISAAGIGSGMLLGTFLGSGDFIGVRCGRHGRGIHSFCSILSGGHANYPCCSNCTLQL